MVAFVSAVNGVEARTQTSPDASLIAVVRPPILNIPSRVNGLVEVNCHNDSLSRKKMAITHVEKVQILLTTLGPKIPSEK
jgi:hypothetical protein